MKYNGLIIVMAILLPLGLYAQERTDSAADGQKITNLKEVVVQSERAWIEGNKAVFIPSKHERNLSNSPASLIEQMNIPVVRVDRGKVTSMSGQDVTYFINGTRADETDISTFWPKDAKRVEYIENPTDPRFEGCRYVINFVMTEYQTGGITKIDVDQTFPNSGTYDLSSKLVYKEMTYGLGLKGGYDRDHRNDYERSEIFRDVWYQGQLYDEIENADCGNSWNRSDDMSAGFNARWLRGDTRITHNVSLNWRRNPESGTYASSNWNPTLFDSEIARSLSNSRTLSPKVTGNYRFKLSRKWSVNAGFSYAYAHNNSFTSYQQIPNDVIENSVRENSHSMSVGIVPQFNINKQMQLYLKAQTSMSWYEIEYSGSADAHQKQREGTTDVSATFSWQATPTFSFYLGPGVKMSYWDMGNSKSQTHITPYGNAGLYWAPTRKIMLNAFVQYFNNSPLTSQMADLMLRQTDLIWLHGNPNLKNASSWMNGVYTNWMVCSWFNIGASVGYTLDHNPLILSYTTAPVDMGGIIRRYINGGNEHTASANIFVNFRLFDNRLDVNLQPVYLYSRTMGEYARSLAWWRLRGSVSYRIGDFRISAYYSTPQKFMSAGGMSTGWYDHDYNISLRWGNGNWYVRAELTDFLSKRNKKWDKVDAACYSYVNNVRGAGIRCSINVTYTFGYGKKVDDSIDVDTSGSSSSGVLR